MANTRITRCRAYRWYPCAPQVDDATKAAVGLKLFCFLSLPPFLATSSMTLPVARFALLFYWQHDFENDHCCCYRSTSSTATTATTATCYYATTAATATTATMLLLPLLLLPLLPPPLPADTLKPPGVRTAGLRTALGFGLLLIVGSFSCGTLAKGPYLEVQGTPGSPIPLN